MWTKLAWRHGRKWLGLGVVAALIALPSVGWAQEDDDELGEDLGEAEAAEEPAAAETEEAPEEEPPTPDTPPAPPPPPVPPAPPPSPFTFVLKGNISGTVFMQDVPTASGNGGTAIFSPAALVGDKWMLGGDVRQSRVMFTVKGPEVLGGATPVGIMELDLGGGNQITSVPAGAAPIQVRDSMNQIIGTAVNPVTTSAQGDESLLPRVRVAYVELNWGMGENILRVGQFHNLLLPMIAASASHTGTPLGYGAGQLGWRSPGITYLHRFTLSEDTQLDIGLQINRNSWIDNLPPCPPGAAPPVVASCLPSGVSLGEASGLPQFEARLMLSGGKAPSPWPLYAPNVWQVYVVGHWDQKDVSGIGATAPTALPPGTPFNGVLRDSMDTLVFEGGFQLRLGPILGAANGWAGKNSGNVYGNLLQMQLPSAPDVSGMGGWGQLGFSFTPEISLWMFGGVDKPNRDEAQRAGFTRVQNLQLAGMLAYVEGPIVIGLEYLYISTDSLVTMQPPPGVMAPPTVSVQTADGNQVALTLGYSF